MVLYGVIWGYMGLYGAFWDDILAKAAIQGAHISGSVYVVEVVGPSKRHYGQMVSIAFGFGYCLITAYAYGFPDWKDARLI